MIGQAVEFALKVIWLMADVLKTLQTDLKSAGYKTELQAADASTKIPHLYVQLRGSRLEIVPVSAVQKAQGVEVDEKVDYLQFWAPLSISVRTEQAAATARLVAHLNAQIPLVGFCLAADAPQVAFRYLMLIEPGKVPSALAREAVETIGFVLDTFTNALKQVASGQHTVEQAIASLASPDN